MFGPAEADLILVVDPDRMLSDAIMGQGVKPIAGRRSQVVQVGRLIEDGELPSRRGKDRSWEPLRPAAAMDRLGHAIREALDQGRPPLCILPQDNVQDGITECYQAASEPSCPPLRRRDARRRLVPPALRARLSPWKNPALRTSLETPETVLKVRALAGLKEIGAAAWDACATSPETLARGRRDPQPFRQPRLPLRAGGFRLRRRPHRLAAAAPGGRARRARSLGVAPCYLKSHSQGEYVFDHGWADAYERAGGSYYPKLQVSVPFTPVTGPRLLIAPGADVERARRRAGRRACGRCAAETEASSVHVTFLQRGGVGAGRRGAASCSAPTSSSTGSNEGYATSTTSSPRSPRASARRSGASGATRWPPASRSSTLTGRRHHRGALGRVLRLLHGHRRAQMGPALPQPALLLAARRAHGRTASCWSWRSARAATIAGALNFIGDDALYGRNWGCIEEHPFLHFEVCYYQAIDFAIAHGLTRVEAGAQGEHKLARGYRAGADALGARHRRPGACAARSPTTLQRERAHVEAAVDALDTLTPFRARPRPGESCRA